VLAAAVGVDAQEPTRVLRGELGAPHPVPLPELAELSPGTLPLARAATHLAGLQADLSPHGWRLTAARVGDSAVARRVRSAHTSLVALTADVLRGEAAGDTLVRVSGPATLAARLALPGGEPVLADPGAVRDLAQAWVEGAAALAAATDAALPGAHTVVWVDEPDAPDVVVGRVRSSSGYRTLPAWDRAAVREAWAALASARPSWFPLLGGIGEVPGALAHVSPVPGEVPEAWEDVARLVESGHDVALTVPHAASDTRPTPVSQRALSLATPWRSLGLPAAELGRLVLVAAPGRPQEAEGLRRAAIAARDLAEALDAVRRDDLDVLR